MSSEEELPQKNKQKNLPWLPDYIVENCLAHIPRSYYPKLSLVSKSFRSLVVSKELLKERYRLKTRESFFHVCLQLPKSPLPTWFTLWIRPDQIDKKKKNKFSRNTRLVQIPSSYYYPFDPVFTVMVGSEQYAFNQRNAPSPIMWVWNKESTFWHQAPNMTVARVNAVAGVFNGKIYVMGGCPAEESTNWGEVFDTKTQTWESLPDPGAELRSSSIRAIEVINGKLNVRVSNENNDDYAYDPKEGKWDVVEKKLVRCQIGNLLLSCGEQRLWWLDTKRQEWRVVRGLSMLKTTRRRGLIEIGNYGGKLLILWDKFVHPGQFQEKNIWCAVVALERRNGNGDDFEIWGNVECTNVVLTVPSSYVFLRSLQNGG